MSPQRYDHETDLSILEERIGYRFSDGRLLLRAVTHRSYANEHADVKADNQRLEFLGDAVLGVVTAEELFRRYPGVDEGFMSAWQARLVCEEALCDVARDIRLGDFLRLGKGETLSGGRHKPSLLADAYEALLAAAYLDGGLEAVRGVILLLHEEAIEAGEPSVQPEDHKSRLQRIVQRETDSRPAYEIVDELGPAHERRFVAQVVIDGEPHGTGEGRSKKAAEQRAAREALQRLDSDESES